MAVVQLPVSYLGCALFLPLSNSKKWTDLGVGEEEGVQKAALLLRSPHHELRVQPSIPKLRPLTLKLKSMRHRRLLQLACSFFSRMDTALVRT